MAPPFPVARWSALDDLKKIISRGIEIVEFDIAQTQAADEFTFHRFGEVERQALFKQRNRILEPAQT